MSRTRKLAALALVGLALAAAGCGGDDEEGADTEETTTEPVAPGTALQGSVGPGFDISLETADGGSVSTVAPGSYELEVEDLSDIHNFHLSGPGVDVATDVGEEGTQSFQVELEAGTYEFVCDPHAGQMSGSFEVTG
jgi:Copper binding proteins, plastocyanin/azurin family